MKFLNLKNLANEEEIATINIPYITSFGGFQNDR